MGMVAFSINADLYEHHSFLIESFNNAYKTDLEDIGLFTELLADGHNFSYFNGGAFSHKVKFIDEIKKAKKEIAFGIHGDYTKDLNYEKKRRDNRFELDNVYETIEGIDTLYMNNLVVDHVDQTPIKTNSFSNIEIVSRHENIRRYWVTVNKPEQSVLALV